MTRPVRNRLLVGVFVIAAFFIAPRLPNAAMWGATAVATPIVLLALWVSWPFHRARTMLRKQQLHTAH
jgi:membrane protein implicated in regulation of membrane protease activity